MERNLTESRDFLQIVNSRLPNFLNVRPPTMHYDKKKSFYAMLSACLMFYLQLHHINVAAIR